MNNQIQLVLKSSTTELSLNDHELGIYLTPELDGLTGLPEIRTTSGVNAGYDGGWTSAQNYDARSIVIRGVIASEDVATVERLRRQLVALAGQGKNEELSLDLVTEAGNAYTVQVHTMALDMAMQKVLHEQPFMLTLRADDPLIYDASETTHEALLQVAKATGGFRVNFELPLAITGGSEETVVNNDGLEQVPTITRMYGALHNPKLINQTTNQSMQIMADLGYAEGDWINPSGVIEGENLTIDNAPEGAPISSFSISGNTVQNGTPTPDAPVAIQTVTGENVVKISDGQGNEQSYEVNLGKNLFDVSSITEQTAASTNGTENHEVTYSTNNNRAVTLIKVEPNTQYKLSIGDTSYSSRIYFVGMKSTTLESGHSFSWCASGATLTTNSKDVYLLGVIEALQGGTVSALTNAKIQLEKGSTATSYAAYFEPIELCKIGTYQDYIWKDGEDWKVHKAIGKYTFINPSGQGATWDESAKRIYFTTSWLQNHDVFISPHPDATTVAEIKADNFKAISFDDLYINGENGIALSSTGVISMRNNSWTSETEARAAITGTNMSYALAAPTDTEITNEALVAQLEAVLENARMYNPQTNITITFAEGNAQGSLAISYFTDKNPDVRDEIVIDSRLRTVTLNGLDIYHLIAEGSEFLMLAPGENKLSLQSDITGDNGYAQVSYKQGYLSI